MPIDFWWLAMLKGTGGYLGEGAKDEVRKDSAAGFSVLIVI
jgi:hypothetical protein